ncbi:Hypothetical predicted protein [Lecanosticta acicola]|uniref:Methyltransferase domain-containing protein n=1 Tax=Lecanosticta acicola TaxID=111012 RepID=A0AAI8Z3S1_9PEZI|nr:Hypothetical predicted protein [Lecanosticta acicola]
MDKKTATDTYTLPRDKRESSRLEQQHRIVVANTGFHIHPRIKAALPENASIAEIATGTGIWLREVASSAPTGWTFSGFDISPDQFPPGNQDGRCKFEQLNILQPIPSHLENAFDIIHIRYMVIALVGNDWNLVAQNAQRMLKPGGWLQWHESDFSNKRVLQNVPGASTAAQRALFQAYLDLHTPYGKCLPDGINPGLLQTVQKNGYQDIMQDVFAIDRVAETRTETVAVSNWALLWSAVAAAKKAPEYGYDEEGLKELHRKATEEAEGGRIYLTWSMYIVTGRKPS